VQIKILPKIVLHRMHCMTWHIIFFLKSLRILKEIREKFHIKIPPKSPCANFQSPCKFKNPIFILKMFPLLISAQSAKQPCQPIRPFGPLSPPGLFFLLQHRSRGSAATTGLAPPPNVAPASPRHECTAPSTAPHPAPVSPSPSFNPQSKTLVKSKPFRPH
jgi:hypothetical protein